MLIKNSCLEGRPKWSCDISVKMPLKFDIKRLPVNTTKFSWPIRDPINRVQP